MSEFNAKEPRQFARESRPENAEGYESHEQAEGLFFASGPDNNMLATDDIPSRGNAHTAQLKSLQAAANSSAQVQLMRKNQAAANGSSQVQAALQRKQSLEQAQPAIQRKENQTGLPDDLKSGIESLGGYSMDDVKVHYNSDKPAQMKAHAYAQGSDIHIAPGQEQHLAHEAWHVVQQKQGRVQATTQLKGVGINDDSALEKEADVMGAKAMQMKAGESGAANVPIRDASAGNVSQLKRFDGSLGKYVNSNRVDVWLSKSDERKGHLFEISGLHENSKAELIKKITGLVAKEGEYLGLKVKNWVGPKDQYDSKTEDKIDPYRLKISGTHGNGNDVYEIEVHFGPYHHGYIVNVVDGASSGEISDRTPTNYEGKPKADFSSTHHKRGDNNLLADTNLSGKKAVEAERKLDASTKLIGEGARFQSVLNHQGNLTDNSKFFIQTDKNNTSLRWIKFSDLWLSWSATFNKSFKITDEMVAAKIKGSQMQKINSDGSGTEKIDLTDGLPQAITQGVDYSLEDNGPAVEKHQNPWHSFEMNIQFDKKELNSNDKDKIAKAFNNKKGVLDVSFTKTGKTITVKAYTSVNASTLKSVLPDFATLKEDEVVQIPKVVSKGKEEVEPKEVIKPQKSESLKKSVVKDPQESSPKVEKKSPQPVDSGKKEQANSSKEVSKPQKGKTKSEAKEIGLNESQVETKFNEYLVTKQVPKEEIGKGKFLDLKKNFLAEAVSGKVPGVKFDSDDKVFRLTGNAKWETAFEDFGESKKEFVKVTPSKGQEKEGEQVEQRIIGAGGTAHGNGSYYIGVLVLVIVLGYAAYTKFIG